MRKILQTLVVGLLLLQLSLGNLTNIELNIAFNMQYLNNASEFFFNYPTVSKIYQDYLYVQDQGYKIHKINIITGLLQGTFITPGNPIVADFAIFGGGMKIAVCYNDDWLIIFSTINFLEIPTVESIPNCSSIIYLDDVDRLLWANQELVVLSDTELVALSDHLNQNVADKHKVYLSQDKSMYIDFMETSGQGSLASGYFSYNSSSITLLEHEITDVEIPIYQNRVYSAENSSFIFYLLTSYNVKGISVNNASYFYQDKANTTDVIMAFKQMANQMAIVTQGNLKEIKFIGDNNLSWSNVFLIPGNIMAFQISVDKRTLILILQTMIISYQISCINNFYYDPITFDCLPCQIGCQTCSGTNGSCLSCRKGFYSQNCIACHFSCQTCENDTGCLTCAPSMNLIGVGLLCQAAINSTNQILKASDTQNYNDSKPELSQIIPESLFSFLAFPSFFRLPIQSQMLIFIADFWIYSYQNRSYGQKVSQVFQLIKTIENKKWALMQFDKHLNISLSPLDIGLSNYSNYSNPKFQAVEQKSSTFSESLFQFFVYMTPIVILVFLLYRCLFYATFKYRISRHFRKYSLNAFLLFLLAEGNFEYICYCCFNQSLLVFFFNSFDRFNAVVWLLFFFCVIIYVFGIFYITFWFYPKLSSKIIDEAYRILPSFTIYTIMFNGKSFILAAIQSLLFSFYTVQLFAILGVYIFLVTILLYSQIKYGIFKRAIFFNITLLQTIIKIFINFLFLIQYRIQDGDNNSFDMLEDSLIITLYVWAIIILFQIIAAFLPQVKKAQKPMPNIKSDQKVEFINKKINQTFDSNLINKAQKYSTQLQKKQETIYKNKENQKSYADNIQFKDFQKPIQKIRLKQTLKKGKSPMVNSQLGNLIKNPKCEQRAKQRLKIRVIVQNDRQYAEIQELKLNALRPRILQKQ